MNDWDTIEKMINTLPQWDIIKWIMSIQEELKCAKEDNLYQLRQNKNLQSKIDKANKILDKHFQDDEGIVCKIIGEYVAERNEKFIEELRDILKENK